MKEFNKRDLEEAIRFSKRLREMKCSKSEDYSKKRGG